MKKLLLITIGIIFFFLLDRLVITKGPSNDEKDNTETIIKKENKQEIKKKEYVNSVKFKQVGYYKSANKFRCFAYIVSNNSANYTYSKDDEVQILQHAKKQRNTSGTTTQVYYFSKLPIGLGEYDLVLANSFFDAMNICLDLDWKYEFGIYPNGKENFRKNE